MTGIRYQYATWEAPDVIMHETIDFSKDIATFNAETNDGRSIYSRDVQVVNVKNINREVQTMHDDTDYDFDVVNYNVNVSYADFDII
jgi:hypothetical protein